jgi:aminoglycoside phosphotransferase family enzyme/predicted kinase
MASTFERVVSALGSPGTYGHSAEDLTVHETHISLVFLAGQYAYKIKKPVNFGFLDYSTLDRRRYFCEQEVLLNRRLCSGLYLGVVPIVEDRSGIRLNVPGTPMEYAVQMRRLPTRLMMDSLMVTHSLTSSQVERLADRVAEFHARAGRDETVRRFGSREAIRENWEENFAQSAPFVGHTLTPLQLGLLQATARAWMARHADIIDRRASQGFVRDVHGDLRTSAVCFTDPIQVFDCIEFSPKLRCSDVASEIAFMAMDLELRDQPTFARTFVSRYVQQSGDPGLLPLLTFYKCYRACVRGKVESLQATQHPAGSEALVLARRCFALACRYARDEPPPLLLVVCGLSGTGKSAVTARLAATENWAAISSDVVRKELAGIHPFDHTPEAYERGMYGEAMTHRTYEEMAARAKTLLGAGRSVILDATFQHSWEREVVQRLGADVGALVLFLELVATDDTIEERLRLRAADPRVVSDATWDTYLAQKRRWEPLRASAWSSLVIDTNAPLDTCLQRVRAGLAERLTPRGLL